MMNTGTLSSVPRDNDIGLRLAQDSEYMWPEHVCPWAKSVYLCVSEWVYVCVVTYTTSHTVKSSDTSRSTQHTCGSHFGHKIQWVDECLESKQTTGVCVCVCACMYVFVSLLACTSSGGQQTLWKVNSVHYCCIMPFVTWEGTHTGVIVLFIWLTCVVSHPTYTKTFTHTERH